MTYSQAANLAVNQTLVRSINTSVIALLPVASILVVGAYLMHAETLKDLSLALLVGMAAGTYSSIFIATPLLADLKEREPAMRALSKRVAARTSGRTDGAPAPRWQPGQARASRTNRAGQGPIEEEATAAEETPVPEAVGSTGRRAPRPAPSRRRTSGRPGGRKRR